MNHNSETGTKPAKLDVKCGEEKKQILMIIIEYSGSDLNANKLVQSLFSENKRKDSVG